MTTWAGLLLILAVVVVLLLILGKAGRWLVPVFAVLVLLGVLVLRFEVRGGRFSLVVVPRKPLRENKLIAVESIWPRRSSPVIRPAPGPLFVISSIN